MARVIVYLALGVVWTFRSLLAVVADPAYWEPVTTIDWVAVWSYSLGFVLIAGAVPMLVREARVGRPITGIAWVVAAGALLAALANGVEDGVGIESWGSLYIVGSLTTVIGLVILGAALWIAQRPRHAGAAILWLAGFALTTVGLGVLVLAGSIVAIDARRRTAAAT